MKSSEQISISSKTKLFPLILSLTWADSKPYRMGKMLIEIYYEMQYFQFEILVILKSIRWAPN